jgi:amino acid adenylation domain-containing protein
LNRKNGRSDYRRAGHALASGPRGGAKTFGGWNAGTAGLTGTRRSADFEYWRRQLAGEFPQLQLPFDRPKAAGRQPQLHRERFELPSGWKEKIRQLAWRSGCPLYASEVATVAALMQRYSGLDEFILGCESFWVEAHELGDGADSSSGLIALGIDLSGEPSFRALQSRVHAGLMEASAHGGAPFHEVLREMRSARLQANPPFTVAVSQSTAELTSVGTSTHPPFLLDLKFTLEDRDDELCGEIQYSPDLFDQGTIATAIEHWKNLLASACENPDKPVSELPILGEAERRRILYEWNETSAAYPDARVHELFERQAAKTPDLPAVVHQGKALSYRELNERSNQLGHHLQKLGVGPETLVGVCLHRSPEMVIAFLGIWKAGGAYVPLDPAYPLDRLAYMMSDSGAKFLLTTSRLRNLFASAADRTILIDSDWDKIAGESSANPDSACTPENLAYVMYTSGSTGKPKGAMILHCGLVNYLTWAVRAYAFEEDGSVPVHSSISFDLTVTSMYPALLAGGNIELLPEDAGAQSLMEALRRAGRNVVKITPAHLDVLSQELRPGETFAMTKVFVIGGENLPAESLRMWREFAPQTRLINEYGPTETVVGCCIHEVRSEDPQSGPVPIGRPIANTQLYVLDRHRNPVPTGVAGELYIGGDGVARGYLNQPDLTDQKFVPDSFSGRECARLYKTGDIARYRKDGVLEFLGRTDNQVKVRGFRIELGEIEAALMEYPAVKACAVLAREDEPGDKQLVAYAVPAGGRVLAVSEVRNWLKRKLPRYMVPGHFVFLDAFQLTANGKIDRKALPAPGPRRRFADASAVGNDALQTIL